MTINNTWAYNAHDHNFKSANELIRALVEVCSRGGNFLLNIGPQPDGSVQPEFQQRLRAIGDWVTVNGSSIYGSTYGPLLGAPVIEPPGRAPTFICISLIGRPLHCRSLDSMRKSSRPGWLANNQPLTFQHKEHGVNIELPPQAPDPNVSVIALRTV